jgi:hypothetical protein
MPSTNHHHIDRPDVPPVHVLHLREDRFIVHDTAVLRLPHATGTVRRHVDPDGDVTFTGHIATDTSQGWIDNLSEAADLADAAWFVRVELQAARDNHQADIDAAKQRHPAGRAL